MFWSELIVIHLPLNKIDSDTIECQAVQEELKKYLVEYHSWQTCMRNIYVGDIRLVTLPEQINKKLKKKFQLLTEITENNILIKNIIGKIQIEYYYGYDAYHFLLTVILGLHSDILGENEVFHQFRKSFYGINDENEINYLENTNILKDYIKKLCMDLTFDSRIIRTNFMQSLGEISYGGVAKQILRKEKSSKNILVLGTGQLALSLIPWIIQDNYNLHIIARSKLSIEDLHQKLKQDEKIKNFNYNHNFFKFNTYDKIDFKTLENYTLVIAAPIHLSSDKNGINDKNSLIKNAGLILDFRHEHLDEINLISNSNLNKYYDLKHITSFIEQSQNKRSLILQKIEPELKKLVNKRSLAFRQSNIGWVDIN